MREDRFERFWFWDFGKGGKGIGNGHGRYVCRNGLDKVKLKKWCVGVLASDDVLSKCAMGRNLEERRDRRRTCELSKGEEGARTWTHGLGRATRLYKNSARIPFVSVADSPADPIEPREITHFGIPFCGGPMQNEMIPKNSINAP